MAMAETREGMGRGGGYRAPLCKVHYVIKNLVGLFRVTMKIKTLSKKFALLET